MSNNRRTFLQKAVATAVSTVGINILSSCGQTKVQDSAFLDGPTPSRTPEPPRWEPAGSPDLAVFPFGVQVGDSESDSAIVSVQTTESIIEIRVMVAADQSWAQHSTFTDISTEDGFVQLFIDALPSDTAVCVAAFSPQGRSTVTRFRTACSAEDFRIIRFGVTSCMGGNFPWPSLSHAAQEELDIFLFLGDCVYADGSVDLEDYWWHWERSLSQTGFQDLSQSTSIISTWDDHEIDNNWSWNQTSNIETKFANGLTAFRRALPQRIGEGGTGLWHSISWGDVAEFFVLDGRGERRDGLYVSSEQLQWIKEGLLKSSARFKFILNSVPITDFQNLIGDNQSEDRWQGYPEQRTELLSHIENNAIEGVLWLSGDFHYAQHNRVSPPGEIGDTQFEFLCGPTGSFLNPIGGLAAETEQFIWSLSEWNYTLFEADPGTGEVTIKYIGDDGSILHSTNLAL